MKFKSIFLEALDSIEIKAIPSKNRPSDVDIIGAYQNNELIGKASINKTTDPYHFLLSYIHVNPEFRNQGIAKKLVEYIQSKYTSRPIILQPESFGFKFKGKTNEELRAMYSHLGFKTLVNQPNYMIWRPTVSESAIQQSPALPSAQTHMLAPPKI